eukprot:5062294-Pyramimonas_sp.AAC.1
MTSAASSRAVAHASAFLSARLNGGAHAYFVDQEAADWPPAAAVGPGVAPVESLDVAARCLSPAAANCCWPLASRCE